MRIVVTVAATIGVALLFAGNALADSPAEELERAKAELKKLEAVLDAQRAKIKEAESRLKKEAEDKRGKGGFGELRLWDRFGPMGGAGRGGLDERQRQEVREIVKQMLEEAHRMPEKGKGGFGGPPGGGFGPGGFGPGMFPGKAEPKKPQKSDKVKPGPDRPGDLNQRMDKMEKQLDEILRQLRKR